MDLKSVQSIEILTIIDNYADLLLDGNDWLSRQPLATGEDFPSDTLLAEHGLCLLIRAVDNGHQSLILLDAGYSQVGVPHNIERLGLDLSGLDAIVLSHGHPDHFGALLPVLKRIGRPMPVIVHPGAFESPRFLAPPEKNRIRLPSLSREELEKAGARFIWSDNPFVADNKRWAVTGTIERTTDFEKGMPTAVMESRGQMVADPIADDQAIMLHLNNRGLVIISGCAHAGIVNTVRYACRITGEDKVYAVIGGFHLGGKAFEPIIESTIRELQAFGPEKIVPMHCTGLKAVNRMREAFGEKFGLSSVGTRILLSQTI